MSEKEFITLFKIYNCEGFVPQLSLVSAEALEKIKGCEVFISTKEVVVKYNNSISFIPLFEQYVKTSLVSVEEIARSIEEKKSLPDWYEK